MAPWCGYHIQSQRVPLEYNVLQHVCELCLWHVACLDIVHTQNFIIPKGWILPPVDYVKKQKMNK